MPESSGRFSLETILVILATVLFVAQLLVGTAFEFAFIVYVILTIVILTLRTIGYGSVAGGLIIFLALDFIVIGQILKTVQEQPGDSNLGAPFTTVMVLFVGISAICFAAILVSKMLRRQAVITLDPTPEKLLFVRNAGFAFGVATFLIVRILGASASGEQAVGGGASIARQFIEVAFVCIFAETWRVLMVSNGKRSTSPFLFLMIFTYTALGLLADSKQLAAEPTGMYFIAAVAYRRRVTLPQISATCVALVLGLFIAYPIIHILRAQRDVTGLSTAQAIAYVERIIDEPEVLSEDWNAYSGENLDTIGNTYGSTLNYLGYYDDLLARFTLIANTDGIVNVVNQDGPYGLGLVSDSFSIILPTFIYPDKPRVGTADMLTWYYGLRSYGVEGSPTIGVFADSYAALGWIGAAVIPFFVAVFFFLEIQLSGDKIARNFIGAYFFGIYIIFLGGGNIQNSIGVIVRQVPQDLIYIVALFYAADLVTVYRARRHIHQT